jgi:hypothetical protein
MTFLVALDKSQTQLFQSVDVACFKPFKTTFKKMVQWLETIIANYTR